MSHQCAKPGCAERVPDSLLACRVHWGQLPPPLRVEVNDAWAERNATGDAGRHLTAVAEAVRFWMDR